MRKKNENPSYSPHPNSSKALKPKELTRTAAYSSRGHNFNGEFKKPFKPKEDFVPNCYKPSKEYYVNEDVKVIMKPGAVANDIIFPNEFATIKVKFPTESFDKFVDSGRIKEISHIEPNLIEEEQLVFFKTAQAAETALVLMKSAKIGKIIPLKEDRDISLKIKWTEGLLIEIEVKFNSAEALKIFSSKCQESSLPGGTKTVLAFKFEGKHYEGVFDLKKPSTLLVKKGFDPSDSIRLHEEIFEKYIPNILKVSGRFLGTGTDNVSPKEKISLALATNEIKLKEVIQVLKTMNNHMKPTGDIQYSGYFLCLMKPLASGDCEKALALDGRKCGDITLQVYQEKNIFINIEIYLKLKKFILEFLQTLNSRYPDLKIINYAEAELAKENWNTKSSEDQFFSSYPKNDQFPRDTFKINISGKSQKNITIATNDLRTFIRGYPLYIDFLDIYILKDPQIQKELLRIEEMYSVKLFSTERNFIRIYSMNEPPSQVGKALTGLLDQEKIGRYLECKFVNKTGFDDIKNFLKHKYSAFVFIDYRKSLLKILLNRNNIDKIGEVKKDFQNYIEKKSFKPNDSSQNKIGDCVICMCDILLTELVYTTKLCGHKMHAGCYEAFLSDALQHDKELPLTCPECNQILSLSDFEYYNQTELIRLSEKSLRKIVNENNKLFGYCGVKNCSVPLRKISGLLQCWNCKNELCNECLKMKHPGFSCEYAELNLDPKLVKNCPECKVLIEKSGGCNRVTCRCCNMHFCWKCATFKSSKPEEVYAHLTQIHGNIYD